MPVEGEKYFYQNMPKTATNWVKCALPKATDSKIITPYKDHSYAAVPSIDTRIIPTAHASAVDTQKAVITSIREPLDWMRSFWEFRMHESWGRWPLDFVMLACLKQGLVAADLCVEHSTEIYPLVTFQKFVDTICEFGPGLLSALYEIYTTRADYICRVSHIASDTAAAFDQLGQVYDAKLLHAAPRRNVTKGIPLPWAEKHVREEVEAILAANTLEEATIEEFKFEEQKAYSIWEKAGAHVRLHAVG